MAHMEADLQVSSPSNFAFTLPDLLGALSRYRLRAFLVFLSAIVAGIVVILVTTRLYESHAVILIKFGREQVYRPELGAESPPIVPGLSEQDGMVDNQVEMFNSRDVIVPVIKEIGLTRLYPDLVEPPREPEIAQSLHRALSTLSEWLKVNEWAMPLVQGSGLRNIFPDYGTPGSRPPMEQAVRRFARSLSVSRERASDLVHVGFLHPDPQLAQITLHAILVQQRWLSIAVHGGAEPGFYEAAISQTRKQLAEAQEQLAKFRSDNGVLAFQEQLPLLLQEHASLDRSRQQAEADLADANQRIKELERQRPTLPAQVLEFSDTQTASHFAGTTRWTRNAALREVDIELQRNQASVAGLRGRVAELTAQIAALDAKLLTAGERDAHRVILENEIEAEKTNLRSLTARREEARMRSELDRREAQNIAFVQAPTLPDVNYPAQPAPLMYMLFSIMCGLGGALTVAVTSAMYSKRPLGVAPAPSVSIDSSEFPVLGHRPNETAPAGSRSGVFHDRN